jgi:hypothetical protein
LAALMRQWAVANADLEVLRAVKDFHRLLDERRVKPLEKP